MSRVVILSGASLPRPWSPVTLWCAHLPSFVQRQRSFRAVECVRPLGASSPRTNWAIAYDRLGVELRPEYGLRFLFIMS
jgi:hypothetical protein